MPGATYYNNWDNFNVSNTSAITNLFDILGYTVQDYHHSNSTCTSVGVDGNKDDITGLINYMKGVDYFDYDCLLYTSPSPRDTDKSRMPSSA